MKIAVAVKDGLSKKDFMIDIKNKINSDIEFVDSNPDYVFSFGGDGTFLDAVYMFGLEPIYVPVNFGNLGFYSVWTEDVFNNCFDKLNNNKVMHLPTINVKLFKGDELENEYTCINDATVLNQIHTLMLDVFVNDFEIEHFRGTGVCLSTPGGSTAYNKSLGGSIISPCKRLFQLTHIAPINNVVYRSLGNSIVFDGSETVSMRPIDSRFDNALLTIDRMTYDLEGVTKLEFNLHENDVKILVPSEYNFYKRIKNAFIA